MEQKVENLLDISMSATQEERDKSAQLDTGYDESTGVWELIIKYNGDFSNILDRYAKYSVTGYPLLNQFAVLNVPKEIIDAMTRDSSIQYIEMPKRLFFALDDALAASCLTNRFQVEGSPSFLGGEGVITAVIDTGIDIFDRRFRDEQGNTRIAWLWDQTKEVNGNEEIGSTVPEYGFGTQYDSGQINEAILNRIPIAVDPTGHGTDVASIACGRYGVAGRSTIIFVKLKLPSSDGFPRTTQVMSAIDYVVRRASLMNMPVAVNLSFGNNYGSHRGDSLLEQYIDGAASYGRNVICIGCGNEAARPIHKGFYLNRQENTTVDLAVTAAESALSMQIWSYYWDNINVELVAPDGSVFAPIQNDNTAVRYRTGGTNILAYKGIASPYSIMQEIYYDFIPAGDFINSGVWKIRINAADVRSGRVDIWLQTGATGGTNTGLLQADVRAGAQTGFLQPDAEMTITIPATCARGIAVGAYNQLNNTYAVFSGRGIDKDGFWGNFKPDICAPGVNIAVATGRFVTGTSFAVPFVTGAAALLMEWGIVRGNDPFLYGQKVKAVLIENSKRLPNEEMPSSKTGWGKLCIRV